MGADPVAYAIAAASVESPPVDAFSVRKEAKAYGTGRRVEGNFSTGDPVVVVEDVITTGGSTLRQSARSVKRVAESSGSLPSSIERRGRESAGGPGLSGSCAYNLHRFGLK